MAIVALVGLMALTSMSYADDTFHCPKPGTIVTYGTAGSVAFTGQTGLTCEGRSGYRRVLGMIAPGFELDDARAQKLLPLKVGNEIEYTMKMGSSHVTGEGTDSFSMFYMRINLKVARQEKLVTAAGTFDTLVVEQHMLALGHGQGAWLYTFWFVPELGLSVKETYETRAGSGPARVLEASSVRVPS
ncbi:MAG TPA: hypothetical protein VJN67_17225 [Stellaceae bacterium]|nr:hypothetical protein [Stellaceae bacterium]